MVGTFGMMMMMMMMMVPMLVSAHSQYKKEHGAT